MLESDLIEGFRKAGIERHYTEGEPIVLVNEPSTGMYFIIKGEVRVVKRMPTGESVDIATMGPGQTMGEISLLLGQPHSATVIAKTEVDALLITQSRLNDLRREDPSIALRLYEILATTVAGYLMDVNRQLANTRERNHELAAKLQEATESYSYFS